MKSLADSCEIMSTLSDTKFQVVYSDLGSGLVPPSATPQ